MTLKKSDVKLISDISLTSQRWEHLRTHTFADKRLVDTRSAPPFLAVARAAVVALVTTGVVHTLTYQPEPGDVVQSVAGVRMSVTHTSATD